MVVLLIPAAALAAPQDTCDEAAELFESISSFSDAGDYEIAYVLLRSAWRRFSA